MTSKTIYAIAALLALGGGAFAPASAMAGVRHGAVFHNNAKCGVNGVIPGGMLRGISCRLR